MARIKEPVRRSAVRWRDGIRPWPTSRLTRTPAPPSSTSAV